MHLLHSESIFWRHEVLVLQQQVLVACCEPDAHGAGARLTLAAHFATIHFWRRFNRQGCRFRPTDAPPTLCCGDVPEAHGSVPSLGFSMFLPVINN